MFSPNDIRQEVEAMFTAGLEKPLEAGLEYAQTHCRVRTGELRDSIFITYPRVRGDEIEQSLMTDVAHAHYNEFVLQPFLRPAAQAIIKELKNV